MKRILLTLLLLVAFALPSQAAWEVRQKDTGARTLIDSNSVEVPSSGGSLFIQLSSISTSMTHYVTTNSPGKLRKVYAVGNGAFTAGSNSPVFTFLIAEAATNKYKPLTTGTTGRLTMATTVGLPSSVTISDSTPSDRMSIDVPQGGTIAIYTSTTGTLPSGATLTIVIE
jgi:hypothetical protein